VNDHSESRSEERYRVNTEIYEGPLGLLLELIEHAELDITTLALAQVTDQYLTFLERLEIHDPSEVSSFLVIAAKLLLIKSIHLLPRPPIVICDEEESGEQLVQQLILYKKFKHLSQFLEMQQSKGLQTYLRVTPPPFQIESSRLDMAGMTLHDLVASACNILLPNNDSLSLDQVVTMSRVTIREKIQSILLELSTKKASSFEKIIQTGSRIEIVVTFLALLELIKRQI
jgi:segregation and condensation protein A